VRLVEAWYVESGVEAAVDGRELTQHEREEASLLRVAHPEKVRVVVTNQFPVPQTPELYALVSKYGLGSAAEGGRTHQYTIFVKRKYAGAAWLLRHELVHVGQLERMGTEGFLRRYITELNVVGYSRAPLETEADNQSRSINTH
jgi:hypothetical protein